MKTIEVSEEIALEIEKNARKNAANNLLEVCRISQSDEEFSINLRQIRLNCVCLLGAEASAFCGSGHGSIEQFLKELCEYVTLEYNFINDCKKQGGH